MIFSVRRPQYFISRTKSQRLLVTPQTALTHFTRKECKVIYLPEVTRDLSAGRVGVALQATVENKRLGMRNKILRSSNAK